MQNEKDAYQSISLELLKRKQYFLLHFIKYRNVVSFEYDSFEMFPFHNFLFFLLKKTFFINFNDYMK